MEKIKDLFKSKLFWAAVVGLVVICLSAFFPGLQASPGALTAAVLVIVSYIVGEAVEGGVTPDLTPFWTKIKYLLASRKFWAAVAGTIVVIIKQWKPDFPLSEEQITEIAVLLSAYILGVGVSDRVKAASGPIG